MQRFWSKVNKSEDSSQCWEWMASTKGKGYGRFKIAGKYYSAHRVAFELSKGSIPFGIQVCHTCDNMKCCNPKHLFLGTNLDNVLDKVAKNRQSRSKGILDPMHKLSPEQVLQIRSDNRSHADLAKIYGVSYQQIGNIKYYRAWTHL